MKHVIDTTGYGVDEGWADQITLPNGKFMYTGCASVNSTWAKEAGLKLKTVRYYGACIYANINQRAHENFPIEIDGVDIKTFLDKVATDLECSFSLPVYETVIS